MEKLDWKTLENKLNGLKFIEQTIIEKNKKIESFIKEYYLKDGHTVYYESNHSCPDYITLEVISYGIKGDIVWRSVEDMYGSVGITDGFNMEYNMLYDEGKTINYFNPEYAGKERFEATIKVVTGNGYPGLNHEVVDTYDVSDLIEIMEDNYKRTNSCIRIDKQIQDCEKLMEKYLWEKKKLNKTK